VDIAADTASRANVVMGAFDPNLERTVWANTEPKVWPGGIVGGSGPGGVTSSNVIDAADGSSGGLPIIPIVAGVVVLLLFAAFKMSQGKAASADSALPVSPDPDISAKAKINNSASSKKLGALAPSDSSTSSFIPERSTLSEKDLKLDLTQILGKGAFGTVYSGSYHGTHVAIKEISYKLLDIGKLKGEGLVTEAEAAETLKNEIIFAQIIR
jgi:hypothetical protein